MNALLNLGKVCADVGMSSNSPTHSRQTALKCLRLIFGKINASHSNKIQKVKVHFYCRTIFQPLVVHIELGTVILSSGLCKCWPH